MIVECAAAGGPVVGIERPAIDGEQAARAKAENRSAAGASSTVIDRRAGDRCCCHVVEINGSSAVVSSIAIEHRAGDRHGAAHVVDGATAAGGRAVGVE